VVACCDKQAATPGGQQTTAPHAVSDLDDVSLDQLGQLVGLVDHDPQQRPVPVRAMDAVEFVVGTRPRRRCSTSTRSAWTWSRIRAGDRQPRPQGVVLKSGPPGS
jgi:hypothetical protein